MSEHQRGRVFPGRWNRRRERPLCGCYTADGYLPQVKIDAHADIIQYASRTVFTQTFVNPSKDEQLEEINYAFPLYDGVSVVAFQCTIGDRIISAVVKEREAAKGEYSKAQAEGKKAVLLRQSLTASDAFAMSIGNMPPGGKAVVEITCLWELKHDAEIDGIRFTIPASIAPRYGENKSLRKEASAIEEEGMSVTIDIEMPGDLAIKSIQSPSHPISVSIGDGTESSCKSPLGTGSVTLSQSSTKLDRDFVIEVVPSQHVQPVALLETHPAISNQRALMATLVPKFKLPSEKPEIVFLCDRSGSMGGKIEDLVSALNIFLKSLPVGIKFNIGSFGSHHDFLWPKSKTYSQGTLQEAVQHVATFDANYGGTAVYKPMKATFEQRHGDMNLEVFLLTDGQIWDQENLFTMVNEAVADSGNAIRVFTLGIGASASTALIEGVARAGNGFAQMVQDSEKMSKKVIRMLKAALLPHINDYRLDIKYEEPESQPAEEDFEIIEAVPASPTVQNFAENEPKAKRSELEQPISLFDSSFDDEEDWSAVEGSEKTEEKYHHLPPVSVPSYLQTPSRVPELYPFNRTTVYVILSDSTPSREPKSVVLKGTSKHGPLELEIPIVKLQQSSSIIHQLAARKEIRELEDGRGWLTTIKDSTGSLLKDNFKGRFSDMVEREAVRLGVKFHVGGKWTSFVGVEELKNGPDDQKKGQIRELGDSNHHGMAAQNHFHARFQQRAQMVRIRPQSGSMMKPDFRSLTVDGKPLILSVTKTSVSAKRRIGSKQVTPKQVVEATPSQTSDPGAVPECAPESDSSPVAVEQESKKPFKYDADFLLKLRDVSHGNPIPEFDQHFKDSTSSSQTSGGHKSASRGGGFSMGAFGTSDSRNAPLARTHSSRFDVVSSSDMSPSAARTGVSDGRQPPPTSAAHNRSDMDPPDKLQTIVSLQTFSGSWVWDEKLEQVLGVACAAASGLELPGAVANHANREEVLATCCAMAFIKTKLSEDKEIWEMLMEKAESWLEEQIGGDAGELVTVVSSLF